MSSGRLRHVCSEIECEPEADEVIVEIVAVNNELFLPVGDDDLNISREGADPRHRGQGIGGRGCPTCSNLMLEAVVIALPCRRQHRQRVGHPSRTKLQR